MDYAPMHVINLPPQDANVRKIPTTDDHHHPSNDHELDDEQIMVTKDNVQALVIGILSPHRDDTGDSDIEHKSDHVMSESVKRAGGRETKIKLNFSVDRLLGADCESSRGSRNLKLSTNCVINDCCKYGSSVHQSHMESYQLQKQYHMQSHRCQYDRGSLPPPNMDIKAIVRPTPIRVNIGSGAEEGRRLSLLSYTSMASSLLKFQHHHHHQPPPSPASIAALSSLMAPFNGLKSLQINQQLFRQQSNIQSAAKSLDIPPTTQVTVGGSVSGSVVGTTATSTATASSSSSVMSTNSGKRKRSWSRAVFSNLQRKGLEIQFQQQKYITKPDRRKLAARLNLTDAQVKVWFQNRRMKWRHTRENLKSGQEKPVTSQTGSSGTARDADGIGGGSAGKEKCYTSSSDSDEDEINVVE